ncbi:MAG TPA: peptidase S51 [Thermoanaerobaculia bacterium]|jgi:cyanophycinase|nr:peptidase S51 [Thermoanaerobaculia bacterium]
MQTFALFLLMLAPAAHAELVRYTTGSPDDVRPRLHGPVLDLAGGGADVVPALQAMIDQVRGCSRCPTKLDLVVLRASGADGYNDFLMALDGVDSVVTLVITDRDSANREEVARQVRDAEIVFFAGGDQCNYVRWLKGTRTAEAVKAVYRRGGGVGGTSAGLAIQSDVIYDACPSQSAQSKHVLADPFSVDVSLSRGFFTWPILRGTISDTHFKQRDRMGRLLVFIARAIHDGQGKSFLGIGVSERTSLLVGRDGTARVMGEGPVYLVLGDHKPEVCQRGKPLTFRGFKEWVLASGGKVDLGRRPRTEYKVIDVVEGVLSADPY